LNNILAQLLKRFGIKSEIVRAQRAHPAMRKSSSILPPFFRPLVFYGNSDKIFSQNHRKRYANRQDIYIGRSAPINGPKLGRKNVPPSKKQCGTATLQRRCLPISTEVFINILQLHRQGYSMRFIAKKLSVYTPRNRAED
jgi:hypothetical protein